MAFRSSGPDTYNSEGKLNSKQNSTGKITNITYDTFGFVSAVTDGSGEGTSFDYEQNGKEYYSRVEFPGGKVIERWFDRFRDRFRTDINGETVERVVKNGDDKTVIDAQDNETRYEYDEWKNLTTKIYPDGAAVTYEYEPKFSRLTREVNERGIATEYAYDNSGNLLRRTEAVGTAMERVAEYTYDYDANNQPSVMSVPGEGAITYNAYTWNRPAVITLPGGTKRELAYDPLMRLEAFSVKDSGQNTVIDTQYTHDKMDNVRTKQTLRGNHFYEYDELYRLTDVDNPLLKDEVYTYDEVRNRLTAAFSDQASANTYTHNTNDQLLEIATPDSGLITYDHDLNGNRIQKTEGSEVVN